ncbi:hypothetical protein J5N97_012593 [Dioscorea zingiberensis]|uniref:Uncharacterized protein n=1 Tax=Dioscorea zingiberensis TaxID=325984 RepID=A0A9D5HHY2_9LILI|nr:hypothetical protein J5N97_012593 [Dioscorea zingiberensis]
MELQLALLLKSDGTYFLGKRSVLEETRHCVVLMKLTSGASDGEEEFTDDDGTTYKVGCVDLERGFLKFGGRQIHAAKMIASINHAQIRDYDADAARLEQFGAGTRSRVRSTKAKP